MDLNGILSQIVDFFTTDLGRIIGKVLQSIYTFLYPANAPAAHDVPLPTPKAPEA